jgi:hypothetical protein
LFLPGGNVELASGDQPMGGSGAKMAPSSNVIFTTYGSRFLPASMWFLASVSTSSIGTMGISRLRSVAWSFSYPRW